MADKKVTEFALQTVLPTDTMLIVKSDGTVYRGTIEDIVKATNVVTGIKNKADVMYDSAAAHNAIYRGKDLTEYCDSGAMSKAIAAGTFADIYPGDYITKKITVDGAEYTKRWVVGDLDYHLHRGDTETTAHHVLLFPDTPIGTAKMNETNTTAGGYQGSMMWKTIIPKYVTAVQAAFGTEHVLSHREILTNAMNADADSMVGSGWKGSSYWNWQDTENPPWTTVYVNLFNQAMTYGHAPVASSGWDTGDCNKQIAAFRHGQNFVNRNWYWLRDVASNTAFAYADGGGHAYTDGAATTLDVRPYFLYR